MTYEEWFTELRNVAVRYGMAEKHVSEFNPDDWRDAYDDGYSPEDAFEEACTE